MVRKVLINVILNVYSGSIQLGHTLMKKFGSSPLKALQVAFPEHHFLPWKFKHAPSNFWKNRENVTQAMQWVAEQLKFKSMEDWYRVDLQTLQKLGGMIIISFSS